MAVFKSKCPHCGQIMDLQDEWINKQYNCPSCKKQFMVTEKSEYKPKFKYKSVNQGAAVSQEKSAEKEVHTHKTGLSLKKKDNDKEAQLSQEQQNSSTSSDQAPEDFQENTESKGQKKFIPSKMAIIAFVLTFISIFVYLTRGMWNLIYENLSIGIPLIAVILAINAFMKALKALKEEPEEAISKTGTKILSILTMVLAVLCLFIFIYNPIQDLIPTEHSLTEIIKEQKAGKFIVFYHNIDKKSVISEAQFKRNGFTNFSGTVTINRDGNKYKRSVKVICKYVKGEIKPVLVLDSDYKKDEAMFREDSDLFMDIEFDDERLKDAKVVKVERDLQKENALILTAEVNGMQTEVEVNIEDIKPANDKADSKMLAKVSVWKNKEWYLEKGKALFAGEKSEQNNKKAFEYIKRSAELGNTEAILVLSKCYINGVGVKEDKQKAFELVKDIAEKGNAEAKLCLSQYYFDGTGVTANETKGFNILKELGTKGNIRAKIRMAFCYRDGVSVQKNEIKAFNIMKEASKKGDPDALFYHGLFLYDGIGIRERNEQEAYQKLKQSASQGNTEAAIFVNSFAGGKTVIAEDPHSQVVFARMLLTGKFISRIHNISDWNAIRKNKKISEADKKKAFEAYVKAAKEGNAQAQLELGCCFALGIGCKRDLDLANEHWADAIRTDVKIGMELVKLFDSNGLPNIGYGHGANQFEAAYWLARTANEMKDPGAQVELAIRYMRGSGIEVDIEKANELFAKAVQKDPVQGIKIAEFYFHSPEGIARNHKLTFSWMKKAADNGIVRGMLGLADCYAKGIGTDKDLAEAFDWLEKAADAGDPYAQYRVGCCYLEGNGVPCEKRKAREWFEKAAMQKEGNAMYIIANQFCSDKKEKYEWLQKSAETDCFLAQMQLAKSYEKGEFTEKNVKKAFEWMSKASNQKPSEVGNKIGEAQLELAGYYKKGIGTAVDPKQEFYWIVEAAKNNCAAAQTALADEYWNGNRVQKNKEMAVRLIEKAIRQNYSKAGDWIIDRVSDINFDISWNLIRLIAEKGNLKAWAWIQKAAEEKNKTVWDWLMSQAKDNDNAWICMKNIAEKENKNAWDWLKTEAVNGNMKVWDYIMTKEGSGSEKAKQIFKETGISAATFRNAEKGNLNAWGEISSKIQVGKTPIPLIWGWMRKEAVLNNAAVWTFILKEIGENDQSVKAWECITASAEKGNNTAWKQIKENVESGKNTKQLWVWFKQAINAGNIKVLQFIYEIAENKNEQAWKMIKEIAETDSFDSKNTTNHGWELIRKLAENKHKQAWVWIFNKVESSKEDSHIYKFVLTTAENDNAEIWIWINEKTKPGEFSIAWNILQKLAEYNNKKAWDKIISERAQNNSMAFNCIRTMAWNGHKKAWDILQSEVEKQNDEAWSLTKRVIMNSNYKYRKAQMMAWKCIQSAGVKNVHVWNWLTKTALSEANKKKSDLRDPAWQSIQKITQNGKSAAFEWLCNIVSGKNTKFNNKDKARQKAFETIICLAQADYPKAKNFVKEYAEKGNHEELREMAKKYLEKNKDEDKSKNI